MSEWIAAIETLLVSSQIVLVFVVPRASPPCRLISSTHQCQSNSADFAFYRRASASANEGPGSVPWSAPRAALSVPYFTT